jgi:hypothetical protein
MSRLALTKAASPGASTRKLPRPAPAAPPLPFRDAQEAWFWTIAAVVARREGSPRGVDGAGPPRPAMPEDILRCLDGLYRQRRIDLSHARILRLWGERGMAPDPLHTGQHGEARLWQEALERLEWPLRACGIVGDVPDRY